MEMNEQFEALVNKAVAAALAPHKEAILAIADLVMGAQPAAQEERTATKSTRKAAEPRVVKGAVEAAKNFSVGQKVRYRQGRGEFDAVVDEIRSGTGILILRREQDGKRVGRPASKVIEA